MISVSHLSKKFPGRMAVNDVSFEVGNKELLGFLGPNGAGKTTTMRMLTGFLAPTAGTIRIAGMDIAEQRNETRSRIGYLPENCPLYPEMRVDEYLSFRAAIKGVRGRRRAVRVSEVKDMCGLKDVGRRLIGHLSKGYRQRVGLAEALVHDPELLILDEPTIGLDPNQIRQVRDLIRNLSERHTILLSTHILSEVEAVCNRVLIIHEGSIVASDSPDTLKQRIRRTRSIEAELLGPKGEILDSLASLPGIREIHSEPGDDWNRYTLACEPGADPREALFDLVTSRGWKCRSLQMEEHSLEDVFATLTTATQHGEGPA